MFIICGAVEANRGGPTCTRHWRDPGWRSALNQLAGAYLAVDSSKVTDLFFFFVT